MSMQSYVMVCAHIITMLACSVTLPEVLYSIVQNIQEDDEHTVIVSP